MTANPMMTTSCNSGQDASRSFQQEAQTQGDTEVHPQACKELAGLTESGCVDLNIFL